MDFSQWLIVEEISQVITSVIWEGITDKTHTDVLARAKAGDSDAIDELWIYWQKEAEKQAARMLNINKTDDEAQEAASEAIMHVMEKLKDDPESIQATTAKELGGYVRQAVANVLKMRFRKDARMIPASPTRLPELGQSSDMGGTIGSRGRTGDPVYRPGKSRFPTPDVAAMAREKRGHLRDAEQDLTPLQLSIWELYKLGFSAEDIAEKLWDDRDRFNTVYSHLAKIKNKLQGYMSDLGYDESIDKMLATLFG